MTRTMILVEVFRPVTAKEQPSVDLVVLLKEYPWLITTEWQIAQADRMIVGVIPSHRMAIDRICLFSVPYGSSITSFDPKSPKANSQLATLGRTAPSSEASHGPNGGSVKIRAVWMGNVGQPIEFA